MTHTHDNQGKGGTGSAEERLWQLDDERNADPAAPSMGEGSGPLDAEGSGINTGTRAATGSSVTAANGSANPHADDRNRMVETTVMGNAGSPFTRGSLDANPRNNTTGNQQGDMDAAVESSMSDPLEKPSFLDQKDPNLMDNPDQNQG